MAVYQNLKDRFLSHIDQYPTTNKAFFDLYQIMNVALFNKELPPVKVFLYGEEGDCPEGGYSLYNTKIKEAYGIGISLNIVLTLSFSQVCEVLLHEMVHVYCAINGWDSFDTDTGEHLPVFIIEAAKRGLVYADIWNDDQTQVIDSISIYSADIIDFDTFAEAFKGLEEKKNREKTVLLVLANKHQKQKGA